MSPETQKAIAGPASIGGLALDSLSSVVKGHGEYETQQYLAARDKRNAELGRIKADQTDVVRREELNTTLANIDAIRSAASADPLSPTALAVKGEETRVADRQRMIEVTNIRNQALEDEATAAYRKRASMYALAGGYVGGGAKLGRGLGSYKG